MATSSVLSSPRVAEPWVLGKQAAYALRFEEELGVAPINIWEVARNRGCRVARDSFGPAGGDGLYLWNAQASSALIVVNEDQRASKQRFTVAHELGHHELHRHGVADLEVVDEDIFDEGGDPREKAANAFAAYLLAPDEALKRDLGPRNQKELTPLDVVLLMAKYGISYETTLNRLNNSGLINRPHRERLLDHGKSQVDQLAQEIGYDEATAFPPGDNEVAFVNRGAAELYRDFVISEVTLAEVLNVADPEEAVRIADKKGFGRPETPPYDEASVSDLLK